MDKKELDPYYENLVKNVIISELIKPKNHPQIKLYTKNFEEPYVRILIQRGRGKDEQIRIVKAIRTAIEDSWLIVDRPYTSEYFHKTIDYLLNYERELLIHGKLEENNDPIQQEIDYDALQNSVEKDGTFEGKNNLDLLSQFDKITAQYGKQVESLNHELTRHMKRLLTQSEEEKEQIKKEFKKYKGWHDQWQELREYVYVNIYDEYDGTPIYEHPDDESFMTMVIEGYERELMLEEENKKLRSQQNAWRESPEYKAEIAKLESKTKKQVSVEQIRNGILTNVDGYSKIDDLVNFLLRVNQMLRNTAWDAVADDVEHEAKEAFKNNDISHSKQKTKELQESMQTIAKEPKIGSLILEQNNGPKSLDNPTNTSNSNLLSLLNNG